MGRQRRQPRGKKINPTLFVFCEGQTEEAYINFLKSHYRLPSIIVHSKVSGNNIDRRFIDSYKKDKPTHEKDIDYLMYDIDVAGVLERLQNIENCTLLLSNPCIELWFLLHYKNQTCHVNSEYCCKEINNRTKSTYKKGEICKKLKERLMEKKDTAIERATALKEYNNPSSSIHQFLKKLEELKNG
ncbi:MAG: RloB family protein [Bacteroidota bacterium]